LRTGVRGGLGPGCGFAGGFNGVANVFAIAERSFAEEAAIGGADGEGVPESGRACLPAMKSFTVWSIGGVEGAPVPASGAKAPFRVAG